MKKILGWILVGLLVIAVWGWIQAAPAVHGDETRSNVSGIITFVEHLL
jgi:hypothetical protein